MKKISQILISLPAVFLPFVFPVITLAAESPSPIRGIDLRPTEAAYQKIVTMQFPTLLSGMVKFIMVIAAVIFFFVLVVGGIQWIVSGGDKTGAETARKRITAALVGLAIVFVAFAIGMLINALFGFDIFNLTIPTLY